MSGTTRMEPGGTPLNSVAIAGDDGDYGLYFPVGGSDGGLAPGLNSGMTFPVFFDTGTNGFSDVFLVAPDPDEFLVAPDPDVFLIAPGRLR